MTSTTSDLSDLVKPGFPVAHDQARLDRGLARGLAWSGAARWGGQLLAWAATLVVARVLTPSDYGLVAAASVLVGLFDLTTDCGLSSALVQAATLEKRDIESTMGVTCLVGVAAFLLLVAIAPLWSMLYGDPRLTTVIVVMGSGVVFTAVGSVPRGMLERQLHFPLLAKGQFVQGAVGALITLGLAYATRSYWALAGGFVVSKLAYAAVLSALARVRPRLPRRNARLRSMLRFGYILTGDRVLWYVRQSLDIAIVGRLFGTHLLGFYSMALALARVPVDKLAAVIGPVAFPVFSRAGGDPGALRRHYLALSVGTTTFVLPMSVGLALTAPRLVPLLLGSQWTASVPLLQIFAATTPVVLLWSLNQPALMAVGKIAVNFRLSLFMAVLLPLASLFGANWGMVGVAAGGAIAYLAIAVCGFILTWRILDLRTAEYLRPLVPVLSATAGMCCVVLATGTWLPAHWPPTVILLGEIVAGIVAYPLWLLCLHRTVMLGQLRAARLAWSGGGGAP
ncbi:MAG: lipopolysaccharide biosynthesis protein [Gemmatimonadaceae bacterium]